MSLPMNLTNYISASYFIVRDDETKGYKSLEKDTRRPTSTTDAAHKEKGEKNSTILLGSETTLNFCVSPNLEINLLLEV